MLSCSSQYGEARVRVIVEISVSVGRSRGDCVHYGMQRSVQRSVFASRLRRLTHRKANTFAGEFLVAVFNLGGVHAGAGDDLQLGFSVVSSRVCASHDIDSQ